MPSTRRVGTIVRIRPDKQFAFIRENNSKDEYFAHKTDFIDTTEFDGLIVADPVTFEASNTPKGPRARSVELA